MNKKIFMKFILSKETKTTPIIPPIKTPIPLSKSA